MNAINMSEAQSCNMRALVYQNTLCGVILSSAKYQIVQALFAHN